MYALGVVLYRLCTGRRPFEVRAPEDDKAVLEEEAPAPHLLNPRVPRELSAVCMRLLEKEPQERYESMAELCKALEMMLALADGAWRVPLLEPVTQSGGAAPGLPARGRALLRKVRHRVGWLAAVGGLAACLAVAAWVALARAPGESGPTPGAAGPVDALPSGAPTHTVAAAPEVAPRKEDTME